MNNEEIIKLVRSTPQLFKHFKVYEIPDTREFFYKLKQDHLKAFDVFIAIYKARINWFINRNYYLWFGSREFKDKYDFCQFIEAFKTNITFDQFVEACNTIKVKEHKSLFSSELLSMLKDARPKRKSKISELKERKYLFNALDLEMLKIEIEGKKLNASVIENFLKQITSIDPINESYLDLLLSRTPISISLLHTFKEVSSYLIGTKYQIYDPKSVDFQGFGNRPNNATFTYSDDIPIVPTLILETNNKRYNERLFYVILYLFYSSDPNFYVCYSNVSKSFKNKVDKHLIEIEVLFKNFRKVIEDESARV